MCIHILVGMIILYLSKLEWYSIIGSLLARIASLLKVPVSVRKIRSFQSWACQIAVVTGVLCSLESLDIKGMRNGCIYIIIFL